jgi:hypothetical protein
MKIRFRFGFEGTLESGKPAFAPMQQAGIREFEVGGRLYVEEMVWVSPAVQPGHNRCPLW